MSTEFTKGWRVDGDLIRDETAVIVACRHHTPKALWAEHARVMAASPELLEALKSAETAEAALIGEWANFWDVAPQPLIDKLMKAQGLRNAAIAKATGVTA